MQIDLYNQNEFTKDGVRKLIASKEGVKSEGGLYRLKVTKDGTAYIDHNAWSPTKQEWQNHAILFEFWNRSYVGKAAANDDRWVTEVYKMLKAWWSECLEYGPHKLSDAFYADSMPLRTSNKR
jgi:hypothetical protein